MARTTQHLSALTKLVLTPFTLLRAAFTAVDAARAFGIPGYQALVAKPARIRTTSDPYYRGNPGRPGLIRNGPLPRQSRRAGSR